MDSLRELNFAKIINLGIKDPHSYSYSQYKDAGEEHPNPRGFCISCETKGISTDRDNLRKAPDGTLWIGTFRGNRIAYKPAKQKIIFQYFATHSRHTRSFFVPS